MVEEESDTYEEIVQIPELFYELGTKMKKMSTWFWITLGAGIIFGTIAIVTSIIGGIMMEDWSMILMIVGVGLFSLVMGCVGIITLIIYWQYLSSVKDIRDATGDPIFEKVYQYLLIGIIVMIFNFGILIIVPPILNILVFMELEKWALKMEQLLPTPEMKNITEGYKWLKIGTAVSLCCFLALFVMPVAYGKIGKAYMAEYNSSKFSGLPYQAV